MPRPNEHVARARRKLSGHHNRRYKGKNRAIDRRRTIDEGYEHAVSQLPYALAGDLGDLIEKANKGLLWTVARILVAVEADETAMVIGLVDSVVVDFDGFSISFFWSDGRPKARIVGTLEPVFTKESALVKRILKEKEERAPAL